jgi:hypothetical protein
MSFLQVPSRDADMKEDSDRSLQAATKTVHILA